ncbi:MAG: sigma-70 family RNA polymerase sigma factor [Saprospiraceae bacterium]|nr:sigma-70 family RNA polymerase sigma factor [Saprospiraceae bacterium]
MPDSPNLIQLIQASINGDSKSQERLFHSYAGKMMTLCRRYARSEAEAEDFLQEGFIRVFTYLQSFESSGSFDAWVRKVFVNTALKQIGKKQPYFEDIAEESFHRTSDDVDAVSKLSESEILALLDELPIGYKTVFNLFVIEGYSHREIGELLEIEESTSRSQLVKARKLLQDKILPACGFLFRFC